MLLCSLPSFLVNSWDLCCPYYPGRKSICWMVLKIRIFPYFPILQTQYMFGSMFYCFHSHPVEPWGLMHLPWHVLLHSWGQCSSRRRYYPGKLPKPILTRRLTWKVSIHLFIRFGSQLTLSFVVSASLKTWFCLFMFFLWSEKFWHISAKLWGKFFRTYQPDIHTYV